jgi:hypothetical protein
MIALVATGQAQGRGALLRGSERGNGLQIDSSWCTAVLLGLSRPAAASLPLTL